MTKPFDEETLSTEELRAIVPQLQSLTEKYKKQERVQQALLTISQVTNSHTDLQSLYPTIHHHINTIIEAQNCLVALFEEENDCIHFVFIRDQYTDDCEGLKIYAPEYEDTLTWQVIKTGQPLYLYREKLKEQLANLNIPEEGIGEEPVDWLGAPLINDGKTIGAVVLQSYDITTRYSDEDLELLNFVCQHLSSTISRVQRTVLTEQTIEVRTEQLRVSLQELEDEIEERERMENLQQALFEISELSASLDEDMGQFYVRLHAILSRLIYAPNCYIATVNWDENTLSFEYYADEKEPTTNDRVLGQGLTEHILKTGESKIVYQEEAKALSDAGLIAPSVYQTFTEFFVGWLGVPLIIDGHVFGCVVVQSYDEEKRFSGNDIEILRFVSHHIATAIDRKRSNDALRDYNKQLELMVAKRTEKATQLNISLQQQIEDNKKIEQQLIHQVNHDPLTGLPNRLMFNKQLASMLAKKKRYPSQNKALMFIDLDGFKQINDNFGHHNGDKFLIEVAKRLERTVRAYDSLARLGGDEFVVLLDGFERLTDLYDISERIIEDLSKPFIEKGRQMHAGASVGIVEIIQNYDLPEHIIRDADTAMYEAKSRGRGTSVLFDNSIKSAVDDSLAIELAFKQALKNAEPTIKLFATIKRNEEDKIPFVSLAWENDNKCYVGHGIHQLAAATGLSQKLDLHLIDTLHQIKGECQAPSKAIVPISTQTLKNDGFVNQLLSSLETDSISPDALILCLYEEDIDAGDLPLKANMMWLRQHGVSFLLGEFLSYSGAITNVIEYPFEMVSLNKEVCLRSSPQTEALIKNTITCLQDLGASIIVCEEFITQYELPLRDNLLSAKNQE